MPVGFPFWNFVVDAQGNAIAGASVAVVQFGGNINVFPGNPLALIFSDPNLTQPISQPFLTDNLGRFVFWAASGAYYIQVFGAVTPFVIPVNVGQLPTPTASSLGGVFALTPAVAHQWFNSLDLTGTFHTSQPAFTDISGVATTAQIGTGTPAAGKYVDGGTGAWTTLPTLVPALNLYTNKNLSGSVAVSANTDTLIDSITINAAGGAAPAFPSSGGPFRIGLRYTYFMNGGVGFISSANDGTNEFAAFQGQVINNNSALTGYEWSPVTYVGNAAVTFQVRMFGDGASTIVTTPAGEGSPSRLFNRGASHMAIVIVPSN